MGAPYSRSAVIESMRSSMAKESTPAPGAKETSADTATTAEAPAAEKKETPTGESEGGEAGADHEDEGGDGSGSENSESEGTTAEGDEGETPEEQAPEGGEDEETDGEGDAPKPKATEDDPAGKWDADEQKDLETWGLKDAKPTEETRKIVKIARDNHKTVQELKQQQAQSSDYLAAVGNALVNHDVENLNAMIEELGGEKLPFDVRTEESQIKEVTDGFNAFFDALEKGLTKEEFAKAQTALAPVYAQTKSQVDKLEKKIMERQASDAAVKKLGMTPVKGKYLEGLKAKADKNFALLVREDKKAEAYMKVLEPIFKSGTVLQNPSKAYAMAPQAVHELGEALYFKRNFEKEFLPVLKKEWEAAAKLKRIGAPPPSGKKGGSPEAPASSKDPNRKFNHFAGNRLLKRVGKSR